MEPPNFGLLAGCQCPVLTRLWLGLTFRVARAPSRVQSPAGRQNPARHESAGNMAHKFLSGVPSGTARCRLPTQSAFHWVGDTGPCRPYAPGLQPAQRAKERSPGRKSGVKSATKSLPLCRRHARSRLRRSATRKQSAGGSPPSILRSTSTRWRLPHPCLAWGACPEQNRRGETGWGVFSVPSFRDSG